MSVFPIQLSSNFLLHDYANQVAYLFILEIANSVFDMAMMYEPLIAGFGAYDMYLISLMSTKTISTTGSKEAVAKFPTREPTQRPSVF